MLPGVVNVDVAMFQTSDANVPNDVKERVAFAQTARGIVAARDVDAVSTVAFVFASIVLIAEVIWEFVFAFTFVATDVDAAVIAAASEVEADNMLLFAVVTFVETVARDAPRDVEAARTIAFVFAFTPAAIDDDALPTIVFVLELTLAVPAEIAEASDVEEFATAVLTPEIAEASDVEAEPTIEFVLALIVAASELVEFAIAEFVFALTLEATDVDAAVIAAASEVEAFPTVVLVLLLTAVVPADIAAANDVEALVTSD